jgi:naphtho-gamma-pyrone polyketide synthase
MMAASTDVYVFGDQSIAVLDKLQGLLQVEDNAILATFLREAFFAIRRETGSLPARERDSIAQAENLGLLLEAVRRDTSHAALDGCFLCIYEIGYYIE